MPALRAAFSIDLPGGKQSSRYPQYCEVTVRILLQPRFLGEAKAYLDVVLDIQVLYL